MIKKFTLLLFLVGMTSLLPAQVIINEILTNGEIELKNTGNAMVDVSNYWFCDWPSYAQVGNQTVICGSTNMAPNSLLVVSGFSLDYIDSELGLYSSSAFSSPAALQDYVEWGSSGHQRSTVAVAGGIWSTGDFVPSFSGSASIEFDGMGDAAGDWVAQTANSSCAENAAATGGCTVDGGSISTNDPTTICAGDGFADPINVSLQNNVGTTSAWVITNTSNEILDLPAGPPFDLDDAGAGTCLIWHLSYEPGLTGAAVGNNVSELMGCFALSNAITVVRNIPNGGMISTNDPTEICALDGVPDPINVTLAGEVGTNSAWVITSQTNDILGIETAPPFDLDGAGAGTCLIWHVSYENGLVGLALGENVSDFDGCFSLSNGISVVRTVADGGAVSTADGDTDIEVCVGDGIADVVEFTTTSADANYQYVITDESNVILGLPTGTNNDFEGVAEGTCRVWGLSYTGNITAAVGDNAASTALSDECYTLSSGFITVNRTSNGGNPCIVSTFEIDGGVYQLELSPNPVTEELRIEVQGKDLYQERTTVSILNLEGKVLLEKNYQLAAGAQTLYVKVADLPQGLYLLQFRNSNKVLNDKFVKQ
ncbi:MAG: T9SS type A sorting domain-containing protein [Saprospiraceae bacterium]